MDKIGVGKEYSNNHGSIVKVVELPKGTNTAVVQNTKSGEILTKVRSGLKTGNFKTDTCRTVYGVGYLGSGEFVCREPDGTMTEEYSVWSNMIRRCYTDYKSDKNSTYDSTFVCDAWHNFQVFAKWYSSKCEKFKEFSILPKLDKDLFSSTERGTLYSPDTCCLLPNIINTSLVEKRSTNVLPHGIHKHRRKFVATVMHKYKNYLVSCDSLDEAVFEYRNMKKKFLSELADEYKAVLEDKVYHKLLNWEPRGVKNAGI